eukprot:1974822-Amphidinium_carterae.1
MTLLPRGRLNFLHTAPSTQKVTMPRKKRRELLSGPARCAIPAKTCRNHSCKRVGQNSGQTTKRLEGSGCFCSCTGLHRRTHWSQPRVASAQRALASESKCEQRSIPEIASKQNPHVHQIFPCTALFVWITTMNFVLFGVEEGKQYTTGPTVRAVSIKQFADQDLLWRDLWVRNYTYSDCLDTCCKV